MARKSTGSKLDVLSAEDRALLLSLADGGDGAMPIGLEELVERIDTKWNISIGKSALGEWLAKQREEKEFDVFLSKLSEATVRADAIALAVGDSGKLTKSAIGALSAGLQLAIVSGDVKARDKAAKSLAMVLTAYASDKKADASVEVAGTATAKFQFDAAKSALAHAEELQEINRDETDDKTKVARAIKRLFGEKPKNVRTAAEVLAEDEEAA